MDVAVATDVPSMWALWVGKDLAHWTELDGEVDGAAWVAHLGEEEERYPCALLIPIINILYFIIYYYPTHVLAAPSISARSPISAQPTLLLSQSPTMGKTQSKLTPEQLSELQKNTYCAYLLIVIPPPSHSNYSRQEGASAMVCSAFRPIHSV